jgi:hypothetical protein
MQGRTGGGLRAAVLMTVLGLAAAHSAAALAEPLAERRSHLLQDGTSLLLFPRERVVLSVAADGALEILSATAADPNLALPRPGRADDATAAIREADPGTVAVLMGAVGERGATLLMIASGVSQAFDYRAAALVDPGGPQLTPLKVCTALPLLPSYEQWENASAPAIMLTGFKARASNVVLCPDPPRVTDLPKVSE